MPRKIGDIIRELQEAFQQRYGLVADIGIHIHESGNKGKTSFDMAAQLLGEIAEGLPGKISGHSVMNEYGGANWHRLEANKASVSVFYLMPEEGGENNE